MFPPEYYGIIMLGISIFALATIVFCFGLIGHAMGKTAKSTKAMRLKREKEAAEAASAATPAAASG